MSVFSISRSEELAALRVRLRGQVFTPADAGYDRARTGFDPARAPRPAVVVVPGDSAGVVAAVRFAARAGLTVAVQATGHSPGGAAEGAVMVSTRRLTDVSIDPEARTATVGAGATWAPVIALAREHGLAAPGASGPTHGAVGHVLGGGIGWLSRSHGLGSDSVRSFDLVTPDGTALRTSATELPEVFWALKGGGAGSLGVVTGMRIDLRPMVQVFAGNLYYPVEHARELVLRWKAWVAEAGEELTSAVVVMHFPEQDTLPEAFSGRSFVALRGCWSGAPARGRKLIDSWRDWREPLLDTFGKLPLSSVAQIGDDPVDLTPGVGATEWFDELPEEAVDILLAAMAAGPGSAPPPAVCEIRHAGGAIRRSARRTANDAGLSGEFLLRLGGAAASPEDRLRLTAQLRGIRGSLAPYVNGAAFVNFLEGEEKEARAVTGYSRRNLRRLRGVKSTLDPDNRFRHGIGL